MMSLGLVAQLVEHLALNQLVVGSNPTQPTMNIDYSARYEHEIFNRQYEFGLKGS